MKTHSGYILRGGIKMKKNKSTKVNQIKPLPTNISPVLLGENEIVQEETARIYRESVMHLENPQAAEA
jgi:hypothetical protein